LKKHEVLQARLLRWSHPPHAFIYCYQVFSLQSRFISYLQILISNFLQTSPFKSSADTLGLKYLNWTFFPLFYSGLIFEIAFFSFKEWKHQLPNCPSQYPQNYSEFFLLIHSPQPEVILYLSSLSHLPHSLHS
jgi:hypothetical protein